MSEANLEFPLMVLFTILALIVVLVVAWFAIRFLANINQLKSGAPKPIKIVHTTAVGNRERLVIIDYRGREILLGVTAGGISVIDSESIQHESDSYNDV